MKLVVIHGSLNKGNTFKLAQEVVHLLKANIDVQVDEISSGALNLPFCVSCRQCFVRGAQSCPHYSLMKTVAEKIENADGIILTGAVYSMHLNAAMKNLIDHFSYFYHRPSLFAKKGMIITTAARSDEKKTARYLKSVLTSWGVNDTVTLAEKIVTDAYVLTEKQKQRINRRAFLFYNNVLRNRALSPSFYALYLFNTFRGMAATKNALSEYDKEYWTSNGMINTTYPVKHNPIKKWYGNMVFWILKKMSRKLYKDYAAVKP